MPLGEGDRVQSLRQHAHDGAHASGSLTTGHVQRRPFVGAAHLGLGDQHAGVDDDARMGGIDLAHGQGREGLGEVGRQLRGVSDASLHPAVGGAGGGRDLGRDGAERDVTGRV